jgi:hypothetical protein
VVARGCARKSAASIGGVTRTTSIQRRSGTDTNGALLSTNRALCSTNELDTSGEPAGAATDRELPGMKWAFTAGWLLALAVLSLAVAACGAGWRGKVKSEHHKLPRKITLYVAMSPAVAEGDSGLAAAVVDALSTDLI